MNRYILTSGATNDKSPPFLQAITLLSLYGEYVIGMVTQHKIIQGTIPLRLPQSTINADPLRIVATMLSSAHTSQAENVDKPVVEMGDLIIMSLPALKVEEQRSYLNHFFHIPDFFFPPLLAQYPDTPQTAYDIVIGISNSDENEFNKPAFSHIPGEIYRVVTSKHIIGQFGGGGGGGIIRPPRQPAFRPIHSHPTL